MLGDLIAKLQFGIDSVLDLKKKNEVELAGLEPATSTLPV
jgi:hypothetical protein